MAKRKLIGVIIDSMDGEHEKRVSEYFNRVSVGKGVNLLFFSGSDLEFYNDGSRPYQTIYDLPNIKMLDGLILVLSPMVHHFTEAALEGLLDHLKQVPMASISIPIEGAYNVLLDNEHAMMEMIRHMESHHPIKDICFIGGPSHNNEALVRAATYKKLYGADGGTCDDACLFEGDFGRASGMDAIDYFVKKNGGIPKAVVAANDEMAIGAYQRLSQLGFNVPQEVGIAGFDNIDSSRDFFPPITTYDQHLEDICETAFVGLLGLISGELEPSTVYLRGELVIRESCGCSGVSDNHKGHDAVEVLEETIDDQSAINQIEGQLMSSEAMTDYENIIIIAVMPSQDNMPKIKGYADRMIKNLLYDLGHHQVDGKFLQCVKNVVNQSIITGSGGDLTKLADEFRRHFLSKTSNQGLLNQIEDMIQGAEITIATGIRRQEKYDKDNFRLMYMMSRNVGRDMNNVLATEEVYRILENNLPYYGISRCYVVQYKRPIDYAGIGTFIYPMMSELVFAYDNEQPVKVQSFVTNNMLPTNIIYSEEQHHLIFLALNSGNIHYGYVVFSMDGIDALIYETIRSQMSEALKRQQMNSKRLESERALNNVLRELELSNELLRRQSVRDELTGLYNRRGFYQEAEAYYNEAQASREPFFIIFGDVDKLKRINDLHGHNEGDYALRHIGSVLKAGLPKASIVARMSGDEFTALIGNVEDPSVIKAYMTAIQNKLKQLNDDYGKPYQMSISLGYASYDYDQLSTMDDLLRLADNSLYRVKKRKNK